MTDITTEHIHIFTDGSCIKNPGAGGWAYVAILNGKIVAEKSGYECNTTNNRMEMMAAIQGISEYYKKNSLIIYTDSQYLKEGITNWIKGWIQKGWKTANGQIVKNIDLWQQLWLFCNQKEILWQWVKAHNGNEYNEYVDKLAKLAAQGK